MKLAKSRGETRERRLPELDQRLLKSRVDGVRLAQHYPRCVTLAGEVFEPAAEACFENRPWTERPCVSGCRVKRFEGALGPVVKVVEDGQQNALFAVKIQVERASGDACTRDDVRDTGAPISFARKNPRSSIE